MSVKNLIALTTAVVVLIGVNAGLDIYRRLKPAGPIVVVTCTSVGDRSSCTTQPIERTGR